MTECSLPPSLGVNCGRLDQLLGIIVLQALTTNLDVCDFRFSWIKIDFRDRLSSDKMIIIPLTNGRFVISGARARSRLIVEIKRDSASYAW